MNLCNEVNKMQVIRFKTIAISAAVLTAAALGSSAANALTVNITPSNSIQSAITQVENAGGGTVNLSSGTYVVYSTIVIASNLTLNGAGIGSTVIEPPNSSFQNELISDGTHGSGPNISNLTIENMTLNGLDMNAYESMGIQISPASGSETNITYKNLEVENCAQGSGGPSNTNGLTVTGCNFHDNGYPVQGKSGLYYDNMYFWNGTNVNFSGSYFDDSTDGSGLKWTGSLSNAGDGSTIAITASNNALSGITSNQTLNDVTFLNCICDGNVGNNSYETNDYGNEAGLQFAGNNCVINGCYTQNNGGYGIRTFSGYGTVENCTSTNNGATLTHYELSPNYQLQAVSPETWTMTNDK
jgi:hypothetical protein